MRSHCSGVRRGLGQLCRERTCAHLQEATSNAGTVGSSGSAAWGTQHALPVVSHHRRNMIHSCHYMAVTNSHRCSRLSSLASRQWEQGARPAAARHHPWAVAAQGLVPQLMPRRDQPHGAVQHVKRQRPTQIDHEFKLAVSLSTVCRSTLGGQPWPAAYGMQDERGKHVCTQASSFSTGGHPSEGGEGPVAAQEPAAGPTEAAPADTVMSTLLAGKQQPGGRSWDEVEAAAVRKARQMAFPLGMAAGVFGSMVGVGGGVIVVPAIVAMCKTIPQRVISGTSLLAVCSTATVSGWTYTKAGLVDAHVAALIAAAAMLTAPLGAKLTTTLDGRTLRRILSGFLVVSAAAVPLKGYLLSVTPSAASVSAQRTVEALLANPLSVLDMGVAAMSLKASIGVVAGLASGLLGIGGGTIVTPALALCTSLPQAAVLGTSLLCMLPPSLVGLASHWRLGNVDVRLGVSLASGTLLGSFLGSQMAVQIPNEVLQGVFSVGMLFLGYKTFQSAK